MYRAKDTFWAPKNRRIVKGDLVAAHDPVVEGREGLFEAVVIPEAVAPAKAPEDNDPQSAPASAAKKTAARKTAAAKKPEGGDEE
ncbi:hypothetical protein ACWGDX_24190 [Streptomyces sp. NPDC055025]